MRRFLHIELNDLSSYRTHLMGMAAITNGLLVVSHVFSRYDSWQRL